MSMITSCPACGTMFRVVPDQLKISEGWVRCGHCAEVFDAAAHLSDESILDLPEADQVTRPADLPTQPAELPTQPADLPVKAAPPRPAASPRPRPRPPSPALSPPSPAPSPPPPVPTPAPLRTAAAPETVDRSSESSSFFGTDSQSLEPSPLDSPFVFRPSDLVRSTGDSSLLPEVEAGREYQLSPEDQDHLEPLPNVSFVRQARRRAFWRRPLVRMGLAFASLALAALLVLQFAHEDRDRLALSEPGLRPVLEALCDALDCTLGPPRQIEAIVIESSGFNRLRNDTYRLAFTLRNSARVQVAAPAMELTITDAQDQPIARRVLTAAEIGAPQGAIPAGTELSRTIGLVLDNPGPARVAGYRLLAFYP